MRHGRKISPWKQMPDFQLSPEEFCQLMLVLHRSDSLTAFWKCLVKMVNAAMPTHSVSLYFNYFEMQDGFAALHHQEQPGTPLPWEERRKVSPTPEYLRAHVGKSVFGNEELFTDSSRLSASEYFQKVMCREGWRYLFCLTFWQEERPWAMLVIRKATAMGEFTPAEAGFLKSLHGHCESVLKRLRQSEDQTIIRDCLSKSLTHSGLGLLILNESLEPVFRNEEALQMCLLWNHGRESLAVYEASKAFALPETFQKSCRALAAAHPNPQSPSGPIFLECPTDPSWGASLHLIPADQSRFHRPYFCVQFFRNDPGTERATFPPSVLQRLSQREAEVALAAAHGLSNAEIARRFGKTEATVKAQLLSAFTKLDLKRRSQLAPLLRREKSADG